MKFRYSFKIETNGAPPSPVITVASKLVAFVCGSSCWYANGTGRCIDTVSPKELVKQSAPTSVSAGSRIVINFGSKPNDLGVNAWSNEDTKAIDLDADNSFTLPMEKGIYLYDVFAHWKQGSGSFAFIVEIK
jgi:hypothetical protein